MTISATYRLLMSIQTGGTLRLQQDVLGQISNTMRLQNDVLTQISSTLRLVCDVDEYIKHTATKTLICHVLDDDMGIQYGSYYFDEGHTG
jgi:hypothetical protein